MGWWDRRRKNEDAFIVSVSDPHFERESAEWQAWADAHGWTYRADAPELVGRFRPAFDGAEVYHHLLTTQLHALQVTAFEHLIHHFDPHDQSSMGSLRSFIVVGLPGLPPPDLMAMGAERAIGQLGGSIPSGCDAELIGVDLLAHREGRLDPRRLQPDAELLALEISAVPASFWRLVR